MRDLLSKKSHRQLELLELLFENKRWFHISELAELLHCTERSVKDDLSQVRSSFPDLIFHSSTNGIRIINTDDSDIEMVYHHFFKHSTHFSILEFIFFNEGCDTDSFCKEFYISSSSLYRIIRHINKIIKKQYCFEISLNPVRITGNEIDIRYFFAQYFSEKYYFLEWPFEDFSVEPLCKLLALVYKETAFPVNFATQRMLKLLLVTNLYRIKFGHFLEVEKDSFNNQLLEFLMQEDEMEDIIKKFEIEYNISLTKEVIGQLFVSYFQKMFFIDEKVFLKSTMTDSYVKKSYHLLGELVDQVSREYNIKVDNKDNLIWHLHNTAHLHRQELSTEFILFDQKGNTIKNFQNIFPRFVSKVKEGMEHYLEALDMDCNSMKVNHLTYTFITHSKHLVLNLLQNQPKLKVLVMSNFDQYHAKSIAETLSYYCSNNFELEVWSELELSLDALKESPYDIIISNFIIPPIENKRLIYSNNVNTVALISLLNAMMFIRLDE
ncbi:M protein trans-acting positive regulator PRD domain-containing protein [Streptococcus oralis]|uniref:Helix-turn-helix domain-containing protein n=1 Tax=Streptococcus oralis subsp. oralis TaxID=1891914 RepID=A0A7H9FFK4_STROR|nr:M protein trans-acting positive regulator PRD domain-containing protein [Streptococcus oralis]EIC79479.1 M protein trans-acting positive regulator (MGA) PRD domain protein [Streptococcus oralis SK10]KZX04057.1 aspartate aminotransferase [Streptococcus oralis]MBZ2093264.1 helix-turn-helix domain-containing protein [Streptococcus oralis]QLL97047.1 helix-turn-helix domain-containing protein [Streptococcus oralis subsp. oralis]